MSEKTVSLDVAPSPKKMGRPRKTIEGNVYKDNNFISHKKSLVKHFVCKFQNFDESVRII